ncbi:MAG: YerC/YecD family TrpR-related protein [Candidatus Moraniibacteriota bacterium]|jgi:TrpR-related protein YerC/YecD
MSKIKPYEIDKKEKKEIINEMFEVIECLKTKQEIIDFLLGLFTASEALMMARRIQIAKLILRKKSYLDIREKVGASSHTIQRVEQWLYNNEGKNVTWLKKCLVGEDSKEKNLKSYHYSTNSLDKYAHHRFIKDLFGL